MSPVEPLLNLHQRRHLAVLLSMMQESIADLEALVAPRPHSSDNLTVYDDDVPPELALATPPVVRRLRDAIRRLADQLDIEPQHLSRRGCVRALVVTEIIRIEDSRSSRLRGYGPVAPGLAAVLDPVLSELRDAFQSIAGALGDWNGVPR